MKERSVPIRPGIEEHLIRGAMSAEEFGIYVLIHIQADYRTGKWHGSAPRIVATMPRGASLRKVQRTLQHFEDVGYLKSFRAQGVRGNTAYLIDKFTVRSGALRGYRLNAAKSESSGRPFYELVAEDDAETVAVTVAESDALSRSKKKEVRSENPAAKPAPPADPRHKQVFDFCFEAYRGYYGEPPTWGAKEGTALRRFLKEHPGRQVEEISRRYRNLLDSTDNYHGRQKHGSLCHLLQNFDTFADGPIFAPPQKGKPDVRDALEQSIANSGLDADGRLKTQPFN
jgi:hypothetical protein